MIKVYVMDSCPDCNKLYDKIQNNPNYEVKNIGSHISILKEFIRLRDTNSIFDEARENGYLGIPCFILENGQISLDPKDANL